MPEVLVGAVDGREAAEAVALHDAGGAAALGDAVTWTRSPGGEDVADA